MRCLILLLLFACPVLAAEPAQSPAFARVREAWGQYQESVDRQTPLMRKVAGSHADGAPNFVRSEERRQWLLECLREHAAQGAALRRLLAEEIDNPLGVPVLDATTAHVDIVPIIEPAKKARPKGKRARRRTGRR